ncbi:hypothetical protein [Rhodoplanes sp. SY1]|uniref:hypothetical protein n=1 Tax=Rhodoplanes sp. SY1 TaxID=3166646 RepID=UPI0038B5577C
MMKQEQNTRTLKALACITVAHASVCPAFAMLCRVALSRDLCQPGSEAFHALDGRHHELMEQIMADVGVED